MEEGFNELMISLKEGNDGQGRVSDRKQEQPLRLGMTG